MEALRKRLRSPAGQQLLGLVEKGSDPAALARAIAAVLDETERAAKGLPLVPKADWASPLSVWEDVMLSTPARGKHKMGVFRDFLAFQKASAEVQVPYTAVERVAIFDSVPEAADKVFILLHLRSGSNLFFGKKPLETVLVQFASSQQVTVRNPQEPQGSLEGLAAVVFCRLLGMFHVGNFVVPQRDVFSGSQHELCFKGHFKVNPGFVFPLADGLCFLERPALALRLAELRALQFTRLKSGSASFDLLVHQREGKPLEFSHVARSEVHAIQRWAEGRGLAVLSEDEDLSDLPSSPSKAGPGGKGHRGVSSPSQGPWADAQEEGDSDEEDDSYEPGQPESGEEEGEEEGEGKPRKRRKGQGGAADEAEVDLGDEDSAEDSEASSEDGSDASLVSEDDIPAAKLASKPGRKRSRSTTAG